MQTSCSARVTAASSFERRHRVRGEVPRLLIDARDRAKMGRIQNAFDFVGHVPEDLRPLSPEGAGARCRSALPGNPDDIRVNHQTTDRRDGMTPDASGRRRPIAVARVAGGYGAQHAETPAVSAYHGHGRMRG